MPAAKNYDELVFNPIFKNVGLISEKNSIKRAMMEVSIIFSYLQWKIIETVHLLQLLNVYTFVIRPLLIMEAVQLGLIDRVS